jgi:hypothetical protein
MNQNLNFKADIHVIIKVDIKTGQMMIESGNGQPINPLVLSSICLNIAKVNVDQTLAQAANAKGTRPHQFLALEGEHRCRVPGCGKIRNDAVHTSEDSPQGVH